MHVKRFKAGDKAPAAILVVGLGVGGLSGLAQQGVADSTLASGPGSSPSL